LTSTIVLVGSLSLKNSIRAATISLNWRMSVVYTTMDTMSERFPPAASSTVCMLRMA